MPIENFGLREAVVDATEEVITVYLHIGNPGGAGTSNRVPSAVFGGADIDAGAAGWTIHGSEGRAEVSDDINFGNAGQAVNLVSWYSLFKGANFYARRELAAEVNIANGANMILTGSTVTIEFTSVDV